MSSEPTDSAPPEPTADGIATWVRHDENRYCTRPWKQATILSDGTMVCACIDVTKTNPLGNLYDAPFSELWNGEKMVAFRNTITENIDRTAICRGCPLRSENAPPADLDPASIAKPKILFVESTVVCNLDCHYMCFREPIEGSRNEKMLDFEVYKKLIDDLSPGLIYMEFHIGGENWIHPKAPEMVRYTVDKNPNCYVLTSTNGHFFQTEAKTRAALESGTNCFIFSIDGTCQESYEKYRNGGNFDQAYDAMKRMVAMRNEMGLKNTAIVWRYILFNWNDSEEEMNRAREMAKEIGVDALAWHLNVGPQDISSERYRVGSPHLVEIKDELWDIIMTKLPHADLRLAHYD